MRGGLVWTTILLPIGIVVFFWMSRSTSVSARLEFEPPAIDFGRVGAGVVLRKRIEIRNPTHHAIRIKSFQKSSTCIRLSKSSLKLKPFSASSVLVLVNTPGVGVLQRTSERRFEWTVTPIAESNDDAFVLTPFQIRCELFAPFSLSANEIDLGESLIENCKPSHEPSVLDVRYNHPVQGIGADCDPKLGVCVVKEISSREFRIELRVHSLRARTLPSKLRISTSCIGKETIPDFSVPIHGSFVPDLLVQPQKVVFGSEHGSADRHDGIIRTRSGRSITSIKFENNISALHCEASESGDGAWHFCLRSELPRPDNSVETIKIIAEVDGDILEALLFAVFQK